MGSDLDQEGQDVVGQAYMSGPEALNSVKGIRHFGLKPPKLGGPGTYDSSIGICWGVGELVPKDTHASIFDLPWKNNHAW